MLSRQKIITYVIILIFFVNPLLGSNEKTDSLYAASKTEDTLAVSALIELTDILYRINLDSAIVEGKKALALAKKLNHTQSLIDAYSSLGLCYEDKGEYDKALELYLEMLDLGKKTQIPEYLYKAYQYIGIVYYWFKGYV